MSFQNPQNSSSKSIWSLKSGDAINYQGQGWYVKVVSLGEWEDGTVSKEYELVNGREVRYLSIEEDNPESLFLSQTISNIDFQDKSGIRLNDPFEPPNNFSIDGRVFQKTESLAGIIKDVDTGEEEELLSWDFMDSSQTLLMNVEQWDADDFEVYFGKKISKEDISFN